MAQECKCEDNAIAFGSKCKKEVGRIVKMVIAPIKASDGTYNKIASTDVLTQTFIDGKVQELDLSKRWNFTPTLEEWAYPDGEDEVFTYQTGERQFIRESVKTYSAWIKGGDNVLACDINALGCQESGVIFITDLGNVIGLKKDDTGDTYLMPLSYIRSKFMARDIANNTPQHVMVTFDLSYLITTCSYNVIYGIEADMLGDNMLYGLKAVASAPTATGYTVTMTANGSYGNSDPYTSLVTTDISAYNVTQDAVEPIATFTNVGGGVYNLVFTSATTADAVRVEETATLTAKGFTFASVTETLV